ncbi:MAG TPA: DUF5916 domain-containing protein [Vicinamibacterales bacterium]|nr:DUF5916 domain-containing protein [Vicinamibacterales bacterium]
MCRLPAPFLVLLLLTAPSAAQTPAPPTADARLVTTPPRVDGRLDDAAWKTAALIQGFRQREPQEGLESSEPTTVRVVYDQSTLYIAAELSDSVAADIRASELRRDNTLESDDTFSVLIDSYHDHRNAFVFRINPRGTRFDALVRNESRFYYADWDEQWTAAASLTETGWIAEIAIPFKTLRFTATPQQTWGVNFERVIKRKNELTYWSGWSRDHSFQTVSQAGHLAGLRDIKQAERFRIRPYVVAGVENSKATARPTGTNRIGEVGIDDLKMAVTSTLTADLAINPDFAQTEVDAQQVNLTRFSLFFPEKRQFFIEGAESLRMGVGLLHFGPPPLELFYSRNIGLAANGAPLPVHVGGKLTGKVSGFDVGALNVQTGGTGALDGENFTVGRVRKEVLGRSYIGAIATNRQGNGARNTVLGADGRFTFFEHLNVMGMAARAEDTRVGKNQWATQFGAEWRDDLFEVGGNYIDIDPRFNPGVGFVRIRERLVGVRGSLKPRPGKWRIRQFEITPSTVWYLDDRGDTRSRDAVLTVGTNFQSGDRIDIGPAASYERVVRPFPVGPGVLVPAGEYHWNSMALSFRSYNGRKVSANALLVVGDFYDGGKQTAQFSADIRPGKLLSFAPTYQLNDVDIRAGSFRTHLFGLRTNVSLSTRFLTSAYFQYNSAGQLAATQVRFNYIFRTIDNLYVVFNDTHYTAGVFDGRSNKSLVTKVTYSLHR